MEALVSRLFAESLKFLLCHSDDIKLSAADVQGD